MGGRPACCRCSITTSQTDADLETWRGMSYQTVLTPAKLKTGNVIYPYEKARK